MEKAVTTDVYANQVKLFGKWNCDEVNVEDISLRVCYLYHCLSITMYSSLKCSYVLGLYTDQR